MTSQVFYRKWRPQTLADVVGQEHITKTLLNALESGRVAHAYLFCGPRGTGKTSTGRILAKAINCQKNGKGEPCNACSMCQATTNGSALDVIEIDAASNRGIDDIRELRERVKFAPNSARYKVYIIDEVHMLTTDASNALLKTLEEPPPHAIFVLATTESHKLLPTILSRCQRFDFRRLSHAAVVSKLAHICREEGISIETQGLRLVARSVSGSLRDAENLLQQLVAYYGRQIDVSQVQDMLGLTADSRVRELVGHIAAKDVSAGLATINSLVGDGLDLMQFNRGLVEYLRNMLLVKSGAESAVDLAVEDLAEVRALVGKLAMEDIVKTLKLFGQIDLRARDYSSLPLELALVESILVKESKPQAIARQPAVRKAEPAIPKPAASVSKPETPPTKVMEPVVEYSTKTPKPEMAKPVEQPKAREPAPSEMAVPTPEPVPEPEPPARVPGTSGPPELERIRNQWSDFAKMLKGVRNLDAHLRSSRPEAVEDDTLVLMFDNDFCKEQVESPKNIREVEKKLVEKFGSPNKIRCVSKAKEAKPRQKVESNLVKAAQDLGFRITSREDVSTIEGERK